MPAIRQSDRMIYLLMLAAANKVSTSEGLEAFELHVAPVQAPLVILFEHHGAHQFRAIEPVRHRPLGMHGESWDQDAPDHLAKVADHVATRRGAVLVIMSSCQDG